MGRGDVRDAGAIIVNNGGVRPPDPTRDLGRVGTLLILVSIALLDAVLLYSRDDGVLIGTWWSSIGLSTALLARSPLRRWPALGAAVGLITFVGMVALGLGLRTGFTMAGSQVAQAVIAAAIVTAGSRRPAILDSLAALGRLTVAGVVAGAVAATFDPVMRPEALLANAELTLQVVLQQTLSIVLFCALIFPPDAHEAPRGVTSGRRLRSIPPVVWIQSTTLFVALTVVFVPEAPLPLIYLPIPLLAWGAILLDARFAAGQLLLLAAFATITTADDPGPFNLPDVREYLVGPLTLGYVASAALVSLPIAVIVTQRRKLVNRTAEDEHLFRRTFTESPLGMVLLLEEGDALEISEVNAAAERILGAAAAELEGRRFGDLVGTVDHREHAFDALLADEVDVWHGQAAVLGRPGSRVDLAIAAVGGGGSSRVFSAQLLDQTQEHDSRRRLEAAHKLTDATLDTAACIIIVTDDNGTIVRINASTKEITGYGETALVGSLLWEAPLATLTRSETEAMFLWPNRSGYAMIRERLSYTADGEPIRLVWNNNVVLDETGSPSYAVLTGVDVTAERSSTGLMAHLLQASIATALIGIDVSGRITVFNTGAGHMLGTTAEEMIGQPFVGILDPSQLLVRTGAVGDREAFLCLVGMIGSREESSARDWTWRTRNGHELIVSMTMSVTDDAVEDRVGFLCVGRDVTEQREGQETLVAALDKERTAVERLRSLDRAKDEFVSTVSHELRTPVTSILGYTELLLDGEVVEPHPQQAAMLETIARNSHRLIAICNDLLLLSGFEAREVLANRETYDLREAIAVAQDFAKAACAQRPLTITFSAPETPVLVSGDRSQLDRVFINLVSNAIKFTEDGGTVDIRLAHDDDLGAIITVGDTGIGIHQDDQELVFQRFYRTDTAQSMAIPGTGLGLSIVAGIIDAHGGSIAVDSEPGEGTTFTVQIPVVA